MVPGNVILSKMVNVQVESSLLCFYHVLKVYWEWKCSYMPFSTLALDGSDLSTLHPTCVTPDKGPSIPIGGYWAL